MSTQGKHSHKKSSEGQGEYTDKTEKLKTIVRNSKYLPVDKQRELCASLGLPYLVGVFRKEYTKRFFAVAYREPVTRAEVSKETGIEEKYLCQIKRRLEKAEKLKVLFLDFCKASKSENIQRFSTNPEFWNNDDILPMSNQTRLF